MSYMKQVAKLLGVELGETFEINENSDLLCCFTKKGFVVSTKNKITMSACIVEHILVGLISGEYTIKHKSWKPQQDESYWYVNRANTIVRASWSGCLTDHLLYKLGNCYRTNEDAEANRDKWVAFYESNEVLEV